MARHKSYDYRQTKMELTRFRGRLTVGDEGVHERPYHHHLQRQLFRLRDPIYSVSIRNFGAFGSWATEPPKSRGQLRRDGTYMANVRFCRGRK